MVRDQKRASALAKELEVPESYGSCEELLRSPSIDAVYICTPDDTHAEIAVAAAEHGKHVLCEKPMALSEGECQTMINACKTAKVVLMPAYMMRFHSHHRHVRSLIKCEQFGQIIQMRIQCHLMYHPNGSWRQNPKRGGGCLWDVGSHAVDLLSFLTDLRVENVSGFLVNAFHPYPGKDSGIFTLQLERNVLASVDVSFASSYSERRLEIYGSAGTLLCQDAIGQEMHPHSWLTLKNWAGSMHVPGPRYEAQFEHFAACILERCQPEVTGEDGLYNVRVLSAMERAAAECCTIAVP